MNTLEQLALAIVLAVIGVASFLVKQAFALKNKAEYRANAEAAKRMEMEIRHGIENKSIDQLVDESNKRHGRR